MLYGDFEVPCPPVFCSSSFSWTETPPLLSPASSCEGDDWQIATCFLSRILPRARRSPYRSRLTGKCDTDCDSVSASVKCLRLVDSAIWSADLVSLLTFMFHSITVCFNLAIFFIFSFKLLTNITCTRDGGSYCCNIESIVCVTNFPLSSWFLYN